MDKKTVASLFLLAACLLSASPLCAEDGGAQATATPAAAQSASDLAAAGAQASPDATATPQLTPTPTPAPTATPSPTPFTPQLPSEEELAAAGIGDRILMRGLEGSDVALMQQRLYDLGYYTGDIDGKFGLQTRTAVRDFQRAHGLEKIDGKAGPETLGSHNGKAGGESGYKSQNQEGNASCTSHRCQCVDPDGAAHDQGVRHAVELLKNISDQQRECKNQNQFCRISGGHISCHNIPLSFL